MIRQPFAGAYMPWETADRLEELIKEHQHRFDRGADDLLVYVRFRRGMIEEVHCSAHRFLEVGTRILEKFPLVNVLSLHKVKGHGMRLAHSSELSAITDKARPS